MNRDNRLALTPGHNAVDVILLVDSAKAPMLEAPVSALRAVAASGCQRRLALAFTHFDLVRGQANLPTFSAQRAHVLSAVHQKLASLKEVVGQPAVRAIERELEDRCFMLGFLDRPLTENNRGPVGEMLRLLDFFHSAIAPVTPAETCPVYDTAGLVLAIHDATSDFHNRWDAILGFRRSGNIPSPPASATTPILGPAAVDIRMAVPRLRHGGSRRN